jgi:hypothetical protein
MGPTQPGMARTAPGMDVEEGARKPASASATLATL